VTNVLPAPAHLPAGMKALWDRLQETDRAEFGKFVKDNDTRFGDLGKQISAVKPFADEFATAMQQFPELNGMSPVELAQGAIRLVAVQQDLKRDPLGTVLKIAKSAGILNQLGAVFVSGDGAKPADGQPATAQPQNPAQLIAQLERKISDLSARLETSTSPEKVREVITATTSERDAEASLKNFLDKIAGEYGGQGAAIYQEVEKSIPVFLAMVMEAKGRNRPHGDILADAFDKAINANPEVRARIRAAEAKATDARKTNPQHAEAARRATSVNVNANPTGKERAKTEDEVFGAAYDRAMAH
jgi:hypothetical protein